jgi:glycosyltransferase involved in cell wall biosynthesis
MVLPKPLNKLGKLVFAPLYSRKRHLFQQADGVIAGSESYLDMARSLVPGLPAERTATVYYGIDVPEQRAAMRSSIELPSAIRKLTKKDGETWAVCATTLGRNYGLKTLLEAAEILEQRQVNIKVLIAGIGPLKEYVLSFISSHGLKQTIYIGNHDPATMSRIYSVCDIGLSVYRKDSTVTMPIKAFQYFAAGLPGVNSLKGDLSTLLETHQAGLPYEAENARSLARALEMLASHPDERHTMARNSYDMAGQFDCEVQYAKLVELVERVGS